MDKLSHVGICFMISTKTVRSDSTDWIFGWLGFLGFFGFFTPVLAGTYYVPLGKSLSEFLSLSALHLLFVLQTHQGNGASPLTYLYSAELGKT